MARKNNTNLDKQEGRYYTHNRHPGSGKFWKQSRNRRNRRRGNRQSKETVDDIERRQHR